MKYLFIAWARSAGAVCLAAALAPAARAEQPAAAALRAQVTQEIVSRFAPDIRFHSKERFFPTSAEDLFKGAKVFEVDAQEHPVGPAPRAISGPGDLQNLGVATRVAFDPDNPKVLGGDVTGQGDARIITAPMYVSVRIPSDAAYVSIGYFFLFGFNGSQSMRGVGMKDKMASALGSLGRANPMGGGEPDSFNYTLRTLAEHQGDWEGVEVRLAPDLRTVVHVRTESHGNSVLHAPAELDWTGETHPAIRLAINSHGVYNAKGRKAEDVFVLEDLQVAQVVDVVTQEGPSWRPWLLPPGNRPFRRFGKLGGTPVGEPWTGYRGRMGTHTTNKPDQVVDLDGRPLQGRMAQTAGTHLALFQGGAGMGAVDPGLFNGMPCGGPGARAENTLRGSTSFTKPPS